MKARAVLIFTLLLVRSALCAHDVRPCYLELREIRTGRWEMLWKTPLINGSDAGARPLLPTGWKREGIVGTRADAAWAEERSLWSRPAGGQDERIRIDGLGEGSGDALVRIVRADGSERTLRLTRNDDHFTMEAPHGHAEVAKTYTVLGIGHILSGIDHLLFVLALLIIVRNGRRLVATVTAFTLAHSITLAAAALGIVHVPAPPVEAMIALSIMFVAAEIVHGHQGRPGLTARRPWIVAFIFGLLHGLGFAGALSEVGLPPGAIPVALLFFNVGVELGQLSFIACVLGAIAIMERASLRTPPWAWRVPPYAIGGMAAFWAFQRIAGF